MIAGLIATVIAMTALQVCRDAARTVPTGQGHRRTAINGGPEVGMSGSKVTRPSHKSPTETRDDVTKMAECPSGTDRGLPETMLLVPRMPQSLSSETTAPLPRNKRNLLSEMMRFLPRIPRSLTIRLLLEIPQSPRSERTRGHPVMRGHPSRETEGPSGATPETTRGRPGTKRQLFKNTEHPSEALPAAPQLPAAAKCLIRLQSTSLSRTGMRLSNAPRTGRATESTPQQQMPCIPEDGDMRTGRLSARSESAAVSY